MKNIVNTFFQWGSFEERKQIEEVRGTDRNMMRFFPTCQQKDVIKSLMIWRRIIQRIFLIKKSGIKFAIGKGTLYFWYFYLGFLEYCLCRFWHLWSFMALLSQVGIAGMVLVVLSNQMNMDWIIQVQETMTK